MKRFLKRTATLVLAVMTASAACALPLDVSAAASAFAGWDMGNWTVKTENGIETAVAPSDGDVNPIHSKTLDKNINTITFEMRAGKTWSSVDANMGCLYRCGNGYCYFFEYNTAHQYTQLRRLEENGSGQWVLSAPQGRTLTEGTWYQMKIVFADNYLAWYLDGTLIHEAKDTQDDPMTGGFLTLQGYNSAPSLRNVQLSYTEVKTSDTPAKPVGIDFEFDEATSVNGFVAKGGEVGWKNGRLLWTLGSGNTLTTPNMNYVSGTANSALLHLRNTFCVRMSNHTDAKQVRLYWVTSDDKTYNTAKSKVFDIKSQSDDTTYFFNISDNAKAKGKLYGFRLELIGAKGGTAEIEAITFEHEKEIYDYAGALTSCRVDGDKVIIKGTLTAANAGKTVTLYETEVDNYTESLKSAQSIATVQAKGTEFTFEIPLMNGKYNRLAAMFLLGVDGIRVCDRFMIENWDDTLQNPYAFTLPERTVKVTDAAYGAVGDSFTNDTAAIQKAIDEVSAAGGGTVIVPGDNSAYGRRYIVTTIRLKDNVELRIETGAILWQSPRPADYPYEVVYGHDITISNINWTHAGLCHNYPMIYAYGAKNIRLTGGGMLRSVDTGSECIDSVSGDIIWTGCENRIHIITIAFQGCENVEISNISIRRANCYHMMFRNSTRVWVANLDMREATCASGDGIGVGSGCTDVAIDRCFLYSNDDSITLCPSYNDPRGLVWWNSTPDADNSVRRVTVRSCNLCGGHGLTFIPWGTDNPDLSKQLIEDITVTDCVLAGGSAAIGTWPDNPYHGGAFTNTETDDYSPVQNVTLLRNRCRSAVNLECLQVTGLISDCGLRSAIDFQYGDFEHRRERKGTRENGLSNWENQLLEDTATVTAEADGKNHYGVMQGHASLYQGLYMSAGKHHFSIDVSMTGGEAVLFVKDRVTGELLAEKTVQAGKDFRTNILTFTLDTATTVDIGVETKKGTVRIDNASVTTPKQEKKMYFTENFENGDSPYLSVNSMETVNENGNTFVQAQGGLRDITANNEYTNVKVTFRMRFGGNTADIDANVGLAVCRQGDNEYFLEYNAAYRYIQVRCFKNGNTTVILNQKTEPLTEGEWLDCVFTRQDNQFTWTVGDRTLITFEDSALKKGEILFNAYNVNVDFDDICIEPLGDNATPEYETEAEAEAPTEAPYIPDPEPETEPETETEPESEFESEVESEGKTVQETNAVSDTEPASETGCRSVLAGLSVLFTATAAALWILWRKKHD